MKVYEEIYQSDKWLETYEYVKPIALVNFPIQFVYRMVEHIKVIKEYVPKNSQKSYMFNHITFFYDYNFNHLSPVDETYFRDNGLRIVKFALTNEDSLIVLKRHSHIFIENIYNYSKILKQSDYQVISLQISNIIIGFLKHLNKNTLYINIPDLIYRSNDSTIIRKINCQEYCNENINDFLYKFIADNIYFYNKFFNKNIYKFVLPIIEEVDDDLRKKSKASIELNSYNNVRDLLPLEFFTLWFLEKIVKDSFENKDYLISSNIKVNQRLLKRRLDNIQLGRVNTYYVNTSSSDIDNISRYLPSKLVYKNLYKLPIID